MMTKPGAPGYFGTGVSGAALVADDLDWSWGSGPQLSGLAQDLAAVLCGRRLPAGRLRGERRGPVHRGLIQRQRCRGRAAAEPAQLAGRAGDGQAHRAGGG